MNPVRHVSDRHFILRPLRKERRKNAPAHLSMQATYPIDRSASADCQISHVEIFRRVIRVLPPKGQQIMESDAELFLGITAEILLDQSGRKTIKASRHRRVCSEEITRPRGGQR